MRVVVCKKCQARNRVDTQVAAKRLARCGKCGTPLDLRPGNGVDNQKPLIVTDATFQRDVVQATGRPILVDCWAPWCGPCRVIGPVLDQLAAEAEGRYRITKLNVDDNPRVAAEFQIQSIPTMLIFNDGKLTDRIIGAQPKQTIAERLIRAI